MASNFNLTDFKSNAYLNNLYNPEKLYAETEAKMEQKEVSQAKEALQNDSFGSLTLSEKLAELGVGEKVLQQIGNTAVGMVRELVDPITDYLEKYENIFNQQEYNSEFQSYAKQLFYSNQAMSEQARENPVGGNFVYTM